MAVYMSTAETAKMVRVALREAFPGVKFSVRSSVYAGGSSINVSWVDGPNGAMVDRVAGTFSGAYFDGQLDYKGATKAMIDGVVVQFGADFIFTQRKCTLAFMQAAKAAAVRKYGALVAGVAVLESGGGAYFDSSDYDGFRLANEVANRRTAYICPRRSRTAERVIYLGNDGYSECGALQVEGVCGE